MLFFLRYNIIVKKVFQTDVILSSLQYHCEEGFSNWCYSFFSTISLWRRFFKLMLFFLLYNIIVKKVFQTDVILSSLQYHCEEGFSNWCYSFFSTISLWRRFFKLMLFFLLYNIIVKKVFQTDVILSSLQYHCEEGFSNWCYSFFSTISLWRRFFKLMLFFLLYNIIVKKVFQTSVILSSLQYHCEEGFSNWCYSFFSTISLWRRFFKLMLFFLRYNIIVKKVFQTDVILSSLQYHCEEGFSNWCYSFFSTISLWRRFFKLMLFFLLYNIIVKKVFQTDVILSSLQYHCEEGFSNWCYSFFATISLWRRFFKLMLFFLLYNIIVKKVFQTDVILSSLQYHCEEGFSNWCYSFFSTISLWRRFFKLMLFFLLYNIIVKKVFQTDVILSSLQYHCEEGFSNWCYSFFSTISLWRRFFQTDVILSSLQYHCEEGFSNWCYSFFSTISLWRRFFQTDVILSSLQYHCEEGFSNWCYSFCSTISLWRRFFKLMLFFLLYNIIVKKVFQTDVILSSLQYHCEEGFSNWCYSFFSTISLWRRFFKLMLFFLLYNIIVKKVFQTDVILSSLQYHCEEGFSNWCYSFFSTISLWRRFFKLMLFFLLYNIIVKKVFQTDVILSSLQYHCEEGFFTVFSIQVFQQIIP